MSFCSKCGTELPEGTNVCEKCDVPTNQEVESTPSVSEETVIQPESSPVIENTVPFSNEQAKKKKSIVPAVIALVLVFAIVLGIVFIGGKKKTPNYTMYIKDNELYYTSLDKVEPVKIDDETFVDEEGFYFSLIDATGLSGIIVSTFSNLFEDNKTLLYPQKISLESMQANLFLKDIKSDGAQDVKVDSDVSYVRITEDENTIIYWKSVDEGYDIYTYDVKNKTKEKIIDNAVNYSVTEDVTKILYISDDEGLYIYDIYAKGEKKEKIDGDVISVFYKNDDFSVIRYMKANEIYEKKSGEDKKKIAQDVHSVICSYDSGETYFLKLERESIPYTDLFTDDMKDKDKGIDLDAMKKKGDNSDWDTFVKWYIKNFTALRRSEFRDACKDQKIDREIYSLHYINGDEKKELADNLSSDQFEFSYAFASEKPVLVFNTIDESVMKKLKISEIDFGEASYDNDFKYSKDYVEILTIFRETVEQNYFDANSLKIAVCSTVTDINEDRAFDIDIADDGSAVYFIDNFDTEEEKTDEDRDYDAEWSEEVYYIEDDKLYLNHENWEDTLNAKDTGDVVSIKINNDIVGNNETIDTDVSVFGIRLEEDNTSLSYFKNYNNETNTGDYYINGKEIGYDINGYRVTFVSAEEIYYIAEYDSETQSGELKLYNGKETVSIATDVHSFEISADGKVLFIADYSVKNGYGSLYLTGKKENILIDYDVTAIVPPEEFIFKHYQDRLNIASDAMNDIEVDYDYEYDDYDEI